MSRLIRSLNIPWNDKKCLQSWEDKKCEHYIVRWRAEADVGMRERGDGEIMKLYSRDAVIKYRR